MGVRKRKRMKQGALKSLVKKAEVFGLGDMAGMNKDRKHII